MDRVENICKILSSSTLSDSCTSPILYVDNISSYLVDDCTTTSSHTHGVKIKKKRSSNKDRHSNISTAHGLRDRRMRLSLQVAHPFFQLQDMLGYDKASATVEWLLKQSKPAIDELLQSKHGSPPSGNSFKGLIPSEIITSKL